MSAPLSTALQDFQRRRIVGIARRNEETSAFLFDPDNLSKALAISP